ncbi:MAG: type II toxin-antitoxin system HicB family antitoxin [Bryobacteraceae bacterium]
MALILNAESAIAQPFLGLSLCWGITVVATIFATTCVRAPTKLFSSRLKSRKYSLLIEGDESGYSAHVPELPAILVTGKSMDELTGRAIEAIQLWWENIELNASPTAVRSEIEVELPL